MGFEIRSYIRDFGLFKEYCVFGGRVKNIALEFC